MILAHIIPAAEILALRSWDTTSNSAQTNWPRRSAAIQLPVVMDDSDEQMSSEEDSETESDSDPEDAYENNGHSLENFVFNKKTLKSLQLLCSL